MNINDVDLNLLKVFHAIAEEGSVTRAADRLHLSQPAVSNALKKLRQITGDKLFLRGGRGMILTPRGEDLASSLSGVMLGIEAALDGATDVDPTQINEPIIITSADEEILLHASDILAALEAAGCTAPVQFLPLDTTYRSELLWRKRLAVTISTVLFAPEGLIQRKLYDDALVCLLRADHPAARNLDFDAYLNADHLLIAPLGGAPSGYLDDWLREQGLSRQIKLISHSFGSSSRLVRETGLIATIPRRQAILHAHDPDLRICDLPFEAPTFGVHMFWSERYDKDSMNIWLRNLIVASLTQSASA